MFAVAPGILAPATPGRRLPRGALLVTLVVVFLELPLRAGPFRAPLVYGHPETWAGFWYVVLGPAVRGQPRRPVRRPRDEGGDARRAAPPTSSDRSLLLVPFGFVATVVRRPRYALLTGTDPGDHVLVRGVLRQRRHRALLPRPAADRPDLARGPRGGGRATALERPARPGPARPARRAGPGVPVVGLRARRADRRPDGRRPARRAGGRSTRAAMRRRPDWLDAILDERVAGRDAVIVSWWSYSTPLWYAQHVEGRRPDIRIVDDRTRLDEDLGEIADVIDANLGRRPVIVIQVDPDGARRARAPATGSTALPVPGDAARLPGRRRPRALGRDERVDRARPSRRDPPDAVRRRPSRAAWRAVVLLPGPRRGGQPRAARRGGARDAARPRRPVRDRSSSTTGRATGRGEIADRLVGGAPGRRPGRPPPGQPGLRGRPAVRLPAPPASATSRSPTAIASSGSPTSAG